MGSLFCSGEADGGERRFGAGIEGEFGSEVMTLETVLFRICLTGMPVDGEGAEVSLLLSRRAMPVRGLPLTGAPVESRLAPPFWREALAAAFLSENLGIGEGL